MKTLCPFDNGLLFYVKPVNFWYCPNCQSYFSESELEMTEKVQILTQNREEGLKSGELSESPWLDGEN